jgi:GNAT superfamily N-acetyltransferase
VVDFERSRPPFSISTERARLDLDAAHRLISGSYWATGIPRALFEKSVRNSLPFGVYEEHKLVGFARVISDYATFAYLGDVIIAPEYRGKGLSKWLMESILEHPELQGLRRLCLGTRDAHGLYGKYGFVPVQEPKNWMEIKRVGLYDGGT